MDERVKSRDRVIAVRGRIGSFLESLLNEYGIGLGDSQEPAFNMDEFSIVKDGVLKEVGSDYDLAFAPTIKQFDDAYLGYTVICNLFMQKPDA